MNKDGHRISETSSRKPLKSMKKSNKKIIQREVTLDGMMTFSKLENGLRTLDYECCDDVAMEPFIGTFKVQGMRDGNVYMTQKPKRVKSRPLFRDDNSSLSLGRDGIIYFVFRMPEQLVREVPAQLVRQASAIAQKVLKDLICNQ